ncbi:MAG: tetratricopeptide repeat protein [Flavobacteriales bacterium]
MKRLAGFAILYLLLAALPYERVLAQHGKPKADSLWKTWSNNSLHDTVRLNAIHAFIRDEYLYSKPDSAVYFSRLQYSFAKARAQYAHMAKALITQGIYFHQKGEYDRALVCYRRALSIEKESKNQKGIASAYNNMGSVYMYQGNYAKAIEYYTKSLKIDEKIKYKRGISSDCNNIAIIYKNQGYYSKAIGFLLRGLKMDVEIGDMEGVAYSYNNIGNVYLKLGDSAAYAGNTVRADYYYDLAIQNYFKCLPISEELNERYSQAITLTNIGIIYSLKKDYAQSVNYFNKGLIISRQLMDNLSIALTLNNMASQYRLQGNNEQARICAEEALKIATELKILPQIKDAANVLCNIYKDKGNYKKALQMHELYTQAVDSIESEQNKREVMRQEINYGYEKKSLADSLVNAKKREIQNVEIARQKAEIRAKRNQQYALYGGLFLIVVFTAFIYNRFRLTRQQKSIIEIQKKAVESQKHVIEDKQKEILDSINYAKRLQQAILVSPGEMEKYLRQFFLLYKPKDIVAGDFYFFETTPTHVFIAAADCTGHGVPGAMVSIVCANALTRCVKEFGLTNPGNILDKATELVTETFKKSGTDVKDGMDISFLSINKKTNEVLWAGANTALWYLYEGTIKEISPTKKPVGRSENLLSFKSHNVSLSSDTILYLFTDGYADQFGGPKGKKFKSGNMILLLREISRLPLNEQKNRLLTSFENWRGNLEQIDDVCIIGIRL